MREAYKFHFNFLLEGLQIYFNASPTLHQGKKNVTSISSSIFLSESQFPRSGVTGTSAFQGLTGAVNRVLGFREGGTGKLRLLLFQRRQLLLRAGRLLPGRNTLPMMPDLIIFQEKLGFMWNLWFLNVSNELKKKKMQCQWNSFGAGWSRVIAVSVLKERLFELLHMGSNDQDRSAWSYQIALITE